MTEILTLRDFNTITIDVYMLAYSHLRNKQSNQKKCIFFQCFFFVPFNESIMSQFFPLLSNVTDEIYVYKKEHS